MFPYYEHDLSGLLSEHRLSLPQVKCYLRQLLIGLSDMHKSGFMHRDIKGRTPFFGLFYFSFPFAL